MNLDCPLPYGESELIQLGHGAGGRLTAELLDALVLPAIGGQPDGRLEDAALLPGDAELVVSTDSFVVSPLAFLGGDIGSLAVHGTVNDLAMRGALPLALTLAVIAEEGLPLAELRAVLASAGKAAHQAGVPVITGDTKVVGRGAADRLFLNTTGIGRRIPGLTPSAAGARPGDVLLLSGPIGLHGTAVLSTREGLGFETDIASDTRPLHRLVQALAPFGSGIRSLRDPTRGGLAASLNEIAGASGVGVEIEESAVPVPRAVAAACDLLGRAYPEGAEAVPIGHCTAGPSGRVVLRTLIGARRVVDMPLGEQLPCIC
ncbi:hydrogenase expression/formation protein HypE [Streptomyces sp. NPDC086554]|uniref:hydrogenase expression/formation protein HypE n=1 Tax=Streptomyces sp. NPDC086554 TaxID=3154864 RepID=UPI003431FF75